MPAHRTKSSLDAKDKNFLVDKVVHLARSSVRVAKYIATFDQVSRNLVYEEASSEFFGKPEEVRNVLFSTRASYSPLAVSF
jgi:hypothetical protein